MSPLVQLPKGLELLALLRLGANPGAHELGEALSESLNRAVHWPLQEFLGREGKALRARVVEIGFRLGAGRGELTSVAKASCEALSECIEAIHAGSLIVDDIQDSAPVRRGGPTMHTTHGVPVALNAGNLLYFLGLYRVSTAKLPAAAELACVRRLHRDILRAHFGQALDVSIPIDQVPQAEVVDICLASIRLKSGALMALALTLGALASGKPEDQLAPLDEFGHLLGMGLQMFDDLNNIAPAKPTDPNILKRHEDLRLRRPSWVWASAAKNFDANDYADFVRAVRRLPDEISLTAWLERHDLRQKAFQGAWDFMQGAFTCFERELAATAGAEAALALRELRAVAERFGSSAEFRR